MTETTDTETYEVTQEMLDLGRQLRVAMASLVPAPRTPPPVDLMDDVPTHGTVSICTEGRGHALIFCGDRDFIDRWYNWALNRSVIGLNGQLNWWLSRYPGTSAYVCPRTRRHVLRGLAYQFMWEIRRNREIKPVVDRWDEETGPVIEWDERKIRQLAMDRAREFMRDRIRVDGTALRAVPDLAPVYGVASAGVADSPWGHGIDS